MHVARLLGGCVARDMHVLSLCVRAAGARGSSLKQGAREHLVLVDRGDGALATTPLGGHARFMSSVSRGGARRSCVPAPADSTAREEKAQRLIVQIL
jgi:hypothetical protein